MSKKPKVPSVLTKMIITKFVLGSIFLAGFIVVMICFPNQAFIGLAPGAFAMFTLGDALVSLYNARTFNYVTAEGECVEVELSRLRKRIKAIKLHTARGKVRILVHYKLRTVEIGDFITAYIPVNASVYEKDNEYVVCEYYAVSIAKKNTE